MSDGHELTEQIKTKAQEFVKENFKHPKKSDYVIVETAMYIGASIASRLIFKEERELSEAIEESSERPSGGQRNND